jgi:hypothetical protein
MLGSILGRHTNYTAWDFSWFPSVPTENSWKIPQLGHKLLVSNVRLPYLPVTLSFQAVKSKVHTTQWSKLKTWLTIMITSTSIYTQSNRQVPKEIFVAHFEALFQQLLGDSSYVFKVRVSEPRTSRIRSRNVDHYTPNDDGNIQDFVRIFRSVKFTYTECKGYR